MPNFQSRVLSAGMPVAALLLMCAGLLLTGCATGSQYPRPAVFAAYPDDPALNRVVDHHVEAGRDARERRLLLTTWFQDGTPRGVAQFCSIRPDGHQTAYQWVYEVSTTVPRVKEIPPETLDLIQQALASLPPSQRPPLANMLIVSYWNGGVWQTRLYDRMKRPPGLSTVFELTGAPIVPSP